MAYQIILTEEALRDLKKLDKRIAKRVMSKLKRLAEYADTFSHFALSGRWKGYYRLRVGDYRSDIYDE
jgi:mRNA interferase RelE/StbE